MAVEPIVAGHANLPRATMESPGGRFVTLKVPAGAADWQAARWRFPFPAFLIRHPSAGAILVDTGLHPSIATDGKENFGSLAHRFGKPTLGGRRRRARPAAQTRPRPRRGPVVVMTHMHLDHTSAISEFPKSTFVVSETEWEAAATGPRPILNGYRRAHFDYAFDYRTVDFDRGGDRLLRHLRPHLRPLRRRLDPARLHPRPQRRPHVGDRPPRAERDFVIGGDAMYTSPSSRANAPLPPRPFDAHNFRRSLQELRLFHREFPDAMITPGHDPGFYARLAARYE